MKEFRSTMKCPKCLRLRFMGEMDAFKLRYCSEEDPSCPQDFIQVTCPQCGFMFLEQCADSGSIEDLHREIMQEFKSSNFKPITPLVDWEIE